MRFFSLSLLSLFGSQAASTPVAVTDLPLERRQGFLGGLVGNVLNSMFRQSTAIMFEMGKF